MSVLTAFLCFFHLIAVRIVAKISSSNTEITKEMDEVRSFVSQSFQH